MNSNYFYKLTFAASLGSFQFGYNLAVINNLLNKIDDSYRFLNILCAVGAIFGCLIGCSIGNAFGRRPLIIIMDILCILGNIMSIPILNIGKYCDPWNTLIIITVITGRLICGFTTGMASYIVPLYIREMAPFEIYARLGSINQFMITFGILMAYSLAYLHPMNDLVVLVFMVPALSALLQLVLFRFYYTKETPTYLLYKKQTKEALNVVSRLYFNNMLDEDADELIGSQLNIDFKNLSYKDLLGAGVSQGLKMGCIISVLQQLTGVNFIVLNSSEILSKIGGMSPQVATIIIGGVNCFFGSTSMFLLKTHYKKNMQIGSIGMAVCYLVILVATPFSHEFNYIYFFCILMFIVFFEASIGPIMWIYCADVLSDRGVAITSALNWFVVLCVNLFFSIEERYFIYHKHESNVAFICMNTFYLCSCLLAFYYSRYRMLERSEIISSFKESLKGSIVDYK